MKAWRQVHGRRPASLYLLGAMLLVLLLGYQIVYVRENPIRYAFFLSLYFAFFVAVLFYAVWECIEILRRHFREKEQAFHQTLGEETFVEQLRERVADRDVDT